MQLSDSIEMAWTTIRANKLRTGITVSIIALGITALIGIITAIQAMNQSLKESFSTMGANSFSIRFKAANSFFDNNNGEVKKVGKSRLKQRKSSIGKIMTCQNVLRFKQSFAYPAIVSISLQGNGNDLVQYVTKYKTFKTNPNVSVHGGDENYLELNGFKLEAGRNFSNLEIELGRAVAILGHEVVSRCFGGNAQVAIGKTVKIGGLPYLVIGTIAEKGASAFLNFDNVVITSYKNVSKLPSAANSYRIGVMVPEFALMDGAIGQATGLLRNIRKLDITEDNNFEIEKSDALAEQLIGFLSGISTSAGVIGFITLIGAAIGLMNIMLVAVTERTKEVGLSKALGATRIFVRRQFLFESVIISLLGAVFGIFLGVIIGNIFGIFLKTGFVIPWLWIFGGIFLCFFTGLAAGLYPAGKASRLNPIAALRYE